MTISWTMEGTDTYIFTAFSDDGKDWIQIEKETDYAPKSPPFVNFEWECSEELIDTLDEFRNSNGKVESRVLPGLYVEIDNGAVLLVEFQSNGEEAQVQGGFMVKNRDIPIFIDALNCASRRTYGPEVSKMYQRIGELTTTAGLSPTEALAWTVCKRDPADTEEDRILWTRRLGRQISGPELRSMYSRAKTKIANCGV